VLLVRSEDVDLVCFGWPVSNCQSGETIAFNIYSYAPPDQRTIVGNRKGKATRCLVLIEPIMALSERR
jgi:hypothetical protein